MYLRDKNDSVSQLQCRTWYACTSVQVATLHQQREMKLSGQISDNNDSLIEINFIVYITD